MVIKCQATRSQSQNAKIARSLLADRVEAQEKGDKSRVAIKAAAAKKKKASKLKKTRRKYRELGEGGKQGEADMEEEDEIEIIWDDDVKEGGENKEATSETKPETEPETGGEAKPSEESGKSS